MSNIFRKQKQKQKPNKTPGITKSWEEFEATGGSIMWQDCFEKHWAASYRIKYISSQTQERNKSKCPQKTFTNYVHGRCNHNSQ